MSSKIQSSLSFKTCIWVMMACSPIASVYAASTAPQSSFQAATDSNSLDTPLTSQYDNLSAGNQEYLTPANNQSTPQDHLDHPTLDLASLDNAQTDNIQDSTWIDDTRSQTKNWLNRTAVKLDRWFGEPDPNKSAHASLRFMVDYYHNKYDGDSIEPRIRGRLRLPALENRLSIMIGDDDLDNQHHNIGQATQNTPTGQTFDRQRIRDENNALSLRFSRWQEQQNILTDADIGTRSGGDIYLRLRAEKSWQHNANSHSTLEQIYRLGSKSKHFVRTNFTTTFVESPTRTLTNHSYLEYTHDDNENLTLGNSLYQTHIHPIRLGERRLSYGINVHGKIDDSKPINSYGPFINYRQPIWRAWFFVQGELSYYNDDLDNRHHHLATFLRLEAQF